MSKRPDDPRPHSRRPPHGAPRQRKPAAPAPSKGRTTDWGNVADWYNDLVGQSGSEYHQHVVLPNTLRLLNPQPGERAIDVACGQGVLSRLLAARGAQVTGVDAAKPLIEAARQMGSGFGVQGSGKKTTAAVSPSPSPDTADRRSPGEGRGEGSAQHTDEPGGHHAARGTVPSSSLNPEPRTLNPTYHVADARDLSFLPENHFDLAACVLAIQNIHPIQGVFQTVARALKQGGRFVVVMMHPAFRNAGETHWGWDDEKKVQFRRVDRYLLPRKQPIVAHPGKDPDTYTWTFHKPIEAYVKAARNAGLLMDAMEEWPSHKTSTSGPRANAENTARKEIPMFLAMRCLKVLPPEPDAAAAE